MFNGLDDSGALQDVVSGFHVADHPADFFPYFFIERGSDDFDHLSGGDGADRAALFHRQSPAQSEQESGGVKIACPGAVDPAGIPHDPYVIHPAAVFDVSAARTDLHDCDRAFTGDLVERFQRVFFSCESGRFLDRKSVV